MKEEVDLDINIKFHQVLGDIENIFWFYLLSNNVLADPEIQNILKMKGAPYLLSMLDRYNKWVNLTTKIDYDNKKYTSKMNLLNSSVVIGKAMSIIMYELLKSSKYHLGLKHLEEFRFLRHVRNGAAHDNKFNFKNKNEEWELKEKEVIKWEGYEIGRNLQDTQIFNDFISFSGVFMLANCFSVKLKEIDLG